MSSVAVGKKALVSFVYVCVCVCDEESVCMRYCAIAGKGRQMRGTCISTREQYKLQFLSKAQEMHSVDQVDVGE